MHRANRSTQRTKTLRQHGSGRRTRRTEKQKGRGNGAKPKIYRGGETYVRETSSAQVWTGLKKGLGDLQGQRGKPKSNTYRQGKTSSGTDGSKNDRQRRVSTETKRKSAKLKSRGGRTQDAGRNLPRGRLAGKQEQGWNGDHSLGKKRNSEGNLRFHNKRN